MINLFLNIVLLIGLNSGLEEKLFDVISKQLPEFDKIEMELVTKPDKNTTVELISDKVRISGNFAYFDVEFKTRKNNSRRGSLTVELKLFRNVLVATSDIKRGEALSDKLFEQKVVQVNGINDPIVSFKLVADKRSTNFISKGEVLVQHSIEDNPLIKPGDKVTVHSVMGNVDVNLSAVARQEGVLDQIIVVKTKDNRILKVKVMDYSNVLIAE